MRTALLLVAAGLSVTAAADAAPFKGNVTGYSATLSPTELPVSVYNDDHIVISPFAAKLKWTGSGPATGDTATASFAFKWNPDMATYVSDFTAASQPITVDSKGSYDGYVPIVLAPSDAQKKFAHWCTKVGDSKKIPAQVVITVAGLNGATNPQQIWFNLRVSCLAAK